MKQAILKNEQQEELSYLLHNLAVLNFAEIQSHNDAIEQQGGELGKYI